MDDEPRPRRHRRRVVAGALAVVLLAGLSAAGWALLAGRDGGGDPAVPASRAGTAKVVRQDITTGRSLRGTLGYGAARAVPGPGEGTLTWLPVPGATLERGQQLYRVDDRPVLLFYGGLPLYRPLTTPNMIGRDVRVLADNLKALGYPIGTQPAPGSRVNVSSAPAAPGAPRGAASGTPAPAATGGWTTVGEGEGVLTPALVEAVRRWQKDLKVPVTGTLRQNEVFVSQAAVRVSAVPAQTGTPATGNLMTVTPTARVVTVTAGTTDAGTLDQGDRVTVALPGGRTVEGRIASIAAEAAAPDAGQGPAAGAPKVVVTVSVADAGAVARLDSAEVTVGVAGESRTGVLAVPVEALLALREGGYGLQIVGGGLVAVEVGLFARGMVEVRGDGIVDGVEVVTPT